MEEKKETKLDLKSIGKAASSVKALSDSLKDCQEQMKQMKEVILSILVDTFNSRITYTRLPSGTNHSSSSS